MRRQSEVEALRAARPRDQVLGLLRGPREAAPERLRARRWPCWPSRDARPAAAAGWWRGPLGSLGAGGHAAPRLAAAVADVRGAGGRGAPEPAAGRGRARAARRPARLPAHGPHHGEDLEAVVERPQAALPATSAWWPPTPRATTRNSRPSWRP